VGEWLAVLYHADCPRCRVAIPEYERQARAGSRRGRIALIEMPPYASPTAALADGGSPCAYGRLRADRDWFVEAPTVVRVVDGTVVEATAPAKGANPAGGASDGG
jgi:hypothetical protein